MMKNAYLNILIILFISSSAIGQTKLIAHKSHSGSKSNFSLSLKKNLFTLSESNFGMAPQRFVRNSNLDSVILISDKVAVMITSESCSWEDYGGQSNRSKQLWSAGRDTVHDHPVFRSGNSIKTIKSTLKDEYFFANSIDSVVFIGFDGNIVHQKRIEKPIEKLIETKHPEQNKENPELPKKRPSFFLLVVFSILSAIFRTPF